MLSILADTLMIATRQENENWPDHRTDYADRFTADSGRREVQKRRRHTPYSFFQ